MRALIRIVRSGVPLSLLLAWSFGAWCLWESIATQSIGAISANASSFADLFQDRRLKTDIALFIGAQFLLHTLIGLFIWVVAGASRRTATRLQVGMNGLVAGWSVLVLAAIYVLNASSFPWSAFSASHGIVATRIIGTATIGDIFVVAVVAGTAGILVRYALTIGVIRKHAIRIAAYGVTAMVLLATVRALDLYGIQRSGATSSKPHIIIVGIDSLRRDMVGRNRGSGLTPNIDAFLEHALLFDDATTPLARTFPSWVTILSGRHPTRSGARDNLMPKDLLDLGQTLAHRLSGAGYRAVYATDEVRFSNIDQSYGFDRIIGPKMGPSDFLIGSWGDVPLSNVVVNTRLGALLFPNLYANRAAAKTYEPRTFVDQLMAGVDFDVPTFLALHLTLPHTPFYWAEDSDAFFGRGTEHRQAYLASVVAADRQFGELVRELERKGVLDEALVVVLSDHGEGLGLPSDNLAGSREARAALGPRMIATKGHGASVLSPSQYQVVLAIRRFQSTSPVQSDVARVSAVPASLEDVTPTVLSLAGVAYDAREFDGLSLAGEFAAEAGLATLKSRIRFTETGLTTANMRMGDFGAEANLEEGLQFFAVDSQLSRVVFRRDRLKQVAANKERAALSEHWLLAALPDADRPKFVLVNRAGGTPVIVTHDPDCITQTDFAELWQAMRGRYVNELPEDASRRAKCTDERPERGLFSSLSGKP